MNILVACEFSGKVRDAFIKKGHEAWSCDLLEAEGEYKGNHYQGNILDILACQSANQKWDMLIAHPPCTYLANSGVRWLHDNPERFKHMENGAKFFRHLLESDIPQIAVENPVIHKYARAIIGRGHDQIIQPYEFGHNASKQTCLWLRGLLQLKPTNYYPPRIVNGKKRWGNQTDSGQNKLTPSPIRGKLRSITYSGVAEAMADQWG